MAPEKGLGVPSEPPAPVGEPETWRKWQPLVRRLMEEEKVEPIERASAYEGTISLFVDTLRALARPTATASTTTAFTVHSGNTGYQLDYFPQYRYTPTVFGGAALSTPVSQTIANGHYCFEGRKGGTTTRDPRPGRALCWPRQHLDPHDRVLAWMT